MNHSPGRHLPDAIHQLLEPYINAPVECDGFTRLAHTALEQAEIPHACMVGRVTSADGHRQSPTRFWIQLHDGRLIDYRARMWLGDESSVPHGVFTPGEYAGWQHQGADIELPVLSPILAKFMLLDLPTETANLDG